MYHIHQLQIPDVSLKYKDNYNTKSIRTVSRSILSELLMLWTKLRSLLGQVDV